MTNEAVLVEKKENLFRRKSHYNCFIFGVVSGFVILMSYFFPHEWASAPLALDFSTTMAVVIPAIDELIKTVPEQVDYWRLFYAIFWVMSPVYLILGVLMPILIKDDDKEKPSKGLWRFIEPSFFTEMKHNKFSRNGFEEFAFGTLLIIGMVVFFTFDSCSNTTVRTILNMTSSFVPRLIISWGCLAYIIYMAGCGISMTVIRYRNMDRTVIHDDPSLY